MPENMFFDITNYTFDFNGLDQENRNYVLEGQKEIMITPTTISLLGLGSLRIENTTGDINESVILPLFGDVDVGSIKENTATGETQYVIEDGFIGMDNAVDGPIWRGLQGQLTLSPSEEGDGMLQGILVIEG